MQVELLEVFRVVARQGSISGAAPLLGYTQSAVSRQIAALEAEVGARLLDRSSRGVALTEEGRCLLPHAEAVLDRLDTARRHLDALHGLGAARQWRWRWWRAGRRSCCSGCSPPTRTSPWSAPRLTTCSTAAASTSTTCSTSTCWWPCRAATAWPAAAPCASPSSRRTRSSSAPRPPRRR